MQAELSRQAEDRSGMEQQVARHSEEKRELMSTVKEDAVSKNGLFEPFLYKNEHFAKTGWGQTQGKLPKRTVSPQVAKSTVQQIIYDIERESHEKISRLLEDNGTDPVACSSIYLYLRHKRSI